MADNLPKPCVPCGAGGICGGRGKQTLREGFWTNNPISIQILGVCSALAVTNRLENSLVMGAALIFVCVGSNLFVSLLRKVTPRRIRLIAEVAIIATFVILFDQFLKAFYWDMSKMLGPYVGLIITNCIVMGRAEAFALQNPPVLSVVDGVANGLGYALVLAIIGFLTVLWLLVASLVGVGVPSIIVYLMAVVMGISTMSFHGVSNTLVGEQAEPGQLGVTIGLYSMVASASMMVTPPLFGYMVDISGSYSLVWRVVAAVAFVNTLCLLGFGQEPQRR